MYVQLNVAVSGDAVPSSDVCRINQGGPSAAWDATRRPQALTQLVSLFRSHSSLISSLRACKGYLKSHRVRSAPGVWIAVRRLSIRGRYPTSEDFARRLTFKTPRLRLRRWLKHRERSSFTCVHQHGICVASNHDTLSRRRKRHHPRRRHLAE